MMSLWRIADEGPQRVPGTRLLNEGLKEDMLESWIEADATLLGEPLFMIGRQVQIPDTRDRLDLLALDAQGHAVVIELKRGDLKDPVDVQALRYVSYVAKWSFDEFEAVAREYRSRTQSDFDFNQEFERFCEDVRGELPEDLNADQRIIIVGEAVREKLGSVALWLRDHSVDIKLIEVRSYMDGGSMLIEPKVLVPQKALSGIRSCTSPFERTTSTGWPCTPAARCSHSTST
ncbi:MAG: hypothetical protein RQ745_10710 [Longimicrobiales bacterium]|nr:hypothetical protein [Longimicrobiales bacterium]